MRKPTPAASPSETSTAEHDATSIAHGYTAWHYFLAEALARTRTRGFDVHSFVKLGALPLEADIILLHLDPGADIAEFRQYFSFLVPALCPYLLLEYKSPDDRLTLADFDTVRAYAMLCKRKYGIQHDDEVAVAMMYSRTEADFFSGCARSGFPFVETQPGIRECRTLPLRFHAIDLVTLGAQQPEHPINLLSARRREFIGPSSPSQLGPFGVLYEQVFFTELKKMSQLQVPGAKALLDEDKRLIKLILARVPEEERLHGVSAEARLNGLPLEDRLRGLTPAELVKLRELLLKQQDG